MMPNDALVLHSICNLSQDQVRMRRLSRPADSSLCEAG